MLFYSLSLVASRVSGVKPIVIIIINLTIYREIILLPTNYWHIQNLGS